MPGGLRPTLSPGGLGAPHPPGPLPHGDKRQLLGCTPDLWPQDFRKRRPRACGALPVGVSVFPLPTLADRGLAAAVAGMRSESCGGSCPWRPPCPCPLRPASPTPPRSPPRPTSCLAPARPRLPLWLVSCHFNEGSASCVQHSAAVHLINNLTLQFFRVNAAILFLPNWKRLVKL